MSLTGPVIVDAALLGVGGLALLTLAAAAWTSAREGEPRATVMMLVGAGVVSAPYLLLAATDFPGQSVAGALLLALTAVALAYLLAPGGAPPLDDDTPTTRIDERDIIFSRRLLKPGTERFREYYERRPDRRAPDENFRSKPGLMAEGGTASHPLAFPAAQASFATIERLRPFVEGDVAERPLDIDAAAATRFLERWVLKLGAMSVGFTEVRDYHLYTVVGRGPDYGRAVTLDHRFAIALTVEMDREMLGHAPLAPTVMESAQQYVESGVIAVQVAELIRRLGYPARAHIDGNYRVVCPLVARDAGLGEIGRMGLLMTPELGPRVRIAVVTTDLPLVPSERRRDPTVTDFCARCLKCAEACPSKAIPFGDREPLDGVRRWQIDSEACYTLWCEMGTDCARCMAVCPYSHPGSWLHDLVRLGVQTSERFRRLAVRGDDVVYGRRPAPRKLPEWMG